MLLEDRVITTDLLRHQATLELDEADILLPAGVLETLEDPAFHILIPAGRAHAGHLDKLIVQLVLDTTNGEARVDAMVEDDWFATLPTSYQVLVNVRDLVPGAVRVEIAELEDEPF